MNAADVAARLLDVGPLRLLHGLGGEDARDVWEEVGAEGLTDLALDEAQPTKPRFLAAELLADRGPGWVPKGREPTVAGLYVAALQEQVLAANAWGLPGEVGPAGTHLLALGEVALEQLRPALDNLSPVDFFGSREVGLGRRARWRVADIAATLLASASGQTFPAESSPAHRDATIDELRTDTP